MNAMPLSIPRGVDMFNVMGLTDVLTGREETLVYQRGEYFLSNKNEKPIVLPTIIQNGITKIKVDPINARKFIVESGMIPVNGNTIGTVEKNKLYEFTAREVISSLADSIGADISPMGIEEKTSVETPVDILSEKYGLESILHTKNRLFIGRQLKKIGLRHIFNPHDFLRGILIENTNKMAGFDVDHIIHHLMNSVGLTSWIFPFTHGRENRLGPSLVPDQELIQQYLAGKPFGDAALNIHVPATFNGVPQEISVGILVRDSPWKGRIIPYPADFQNGRW